MHLQEPCDSDGALAGGWNEMGHAQHLFSVCMSLFAAVQNIWSRLAQILFPELSAAEILCLACVQANGNPGNTL